MHSSVIYTVLDSPIGALTLTASDEAITGLYMEDHLRWQGIDSSWERCDERFQEVEQQLMEYFEGERRVFSVAVNPDGTGFQRRVWRELQTIPYGKTSSYGALAKGLGKPRAAQAVGTANGRNPVSILIPCHRVVGTNGELTGYAGGLDRKRFLLELEGSRSASLL